MKVLFATALTAAAVAVASAAEFCDQWGQAKSGNYIIYNNLWGSSAANPGGKQCTALDSGSGDSVAWHTTWSWQGGDKSVKSFANAALEFDPVPLSEVKSIPSTMAYTVKSKGKAVTDVAYDLFTSSTAKGEKEFEIMIWLAALGGAGAISSTGKPIASTTIAGTEWSVYKGPNGSMMVYSFVASKQVENFEGDLLEFFNYLVKEQGFKTSQFLIKVECGTEPFVGTDVTMTVSKYSAAVNTSGGSSTPTQSGESSSSTEQTTTAPAASNTGSSAEQTTPAPAESNTGSSAEQTTPAPAGSDAGSSEEQTPSTPSTGSSTEQTTDAPAASNTGSSEETPSTGSSEETPSTGSSEETPATSDAGSSEETPATSSTGSSEETPVESSTGSSEQNPGQQEPSTPTTSSSSEETPSTETNPKCVLRRVRRE
ncbi:putative hydrolase [Phytophthora sojae]|uniref:Hydrolase n=2 Tax=Phytophthora sojae TaxID=67593 RepID=G4YXW4_PHYSP|nr:putative hydrolase [Phytophthora sojae]ABB22031.1 cell 12A endoglucanase [Phytophthora sojae]EGZ25667.1 putative hydrolase [Phytophthora sojae]|eukprot:XP_009520955.1 putative hydrolase [Phytophthora sojae]